MWLSCTSFVNFFFFNETATTEIYTLSLHDALPIYYLKFRRVDGAARVYRPGPDRKAAEWVHPGGDRKSTRLNSSHMSISYAVFCLKKKKIINILRSASMNRSSPTQYLIVNLTFTLD